MSYLEGADGILQCTGLAEKGGGVQHLFLFVTLALETLCSLAASVVKDVIVARHCAVERNGLNDNGKWMP